MDRSEIEKRLKTRYPPSIYVIVYKGDDLDPASKAQAFFGMLADLSTTGFKLSTESEILTDQEYLLAIRNPFSGRSGELNPFTVKAIWCSQNQDGLYDAGFQFVSYQGESEMLFKRLITDFESTARSINKLDENSELD
jgi:hypothetical protein